MTKLETLVFKVPCLALLLSNMKNKKNIFFLLPIVLIIWGGVIYQFFSIASPAETQKETITGFSIKPLDIKERKNITIDVNYRDPFLGKMYVEQKKTIVTPKKTPKIVEVVNWPTITYKGLISDSKKKNKIFLMIIGGETFYMKKGDLKNEVLLKDGNNESVTIIYKGIHNAILPKG